jgi:NNP family nitrate/nitrite transporter-like MFS transporter
VIKKTLQSNYKWYVLVLAMLTFGIVTGLERMCMPVLFKEIGTDLNLSTVSLGTIWGMDPLAGIFVGLLGGLLVDRFGIKRTLTIVCLLAGVFSALRGFSINFLTLAGSSFLFGAMAAMMPSIVPKAAAIWFNSKQIGFTNALINIALSIFAMIATMSSATVLSPWLDGWRNVLFLLGAPAIAVGLLWLFTGREPRKDEMQVKIIEKVPFRQAISTVIHSKGVWTVGLISLTLWGATMGMSGYLPLYLRDIGWTPAAADGAMTTLNAAGLIGSIPLVILANKLRAYRRMLLFAQVVMAVSLLTMPLVSGAGIWAVLIFSNFVRSVTSALLSVIILETEGIGVTYSGTAMGLMSSLGMIGGTLAPPLGNSFADKGAALPFVFWGALAAASLPLFFFLIRRKPVKLPVQENEFGD